MVEKLLYKRKEKRNHILRSIFLVILGIMLYVGDVWIMMYKLVPMPKKELLFVSICILLQIIGVVSIGVDLFFRSKKQMEDRIKEFEFDAKLDEFLSYPADKVQVKLKRIMIEYNPNFEKELVNSKHTYYVKDRTAQMAKILICKKKKEKQLWVITDYKDFFKYFEPIYSKEKE